MPITIIDTIEPKTPNFNVVDSSNVGHNDGKLKDYLDSQVDVSSLEETETFDYGVVIKNDSKKKNG